MNITTMRSLIGACALIGCATSLSAQQPQQGEQIERSQTVGAATIDAEGTIQLDVRVVGPGGAIGDGRLVYYREDPSYDGLLALLGELREGEYTPFGPWTDFPLPTLLPRERSPVFRPLPPPPPRTGVTRKGP